MATPPSNACKVAEGWTGLVPHQQTRRKIKVDRFRWVRVGTLCSYFCIPALTCADKVLARVSSHRFQLVLLGENHGAGRVKDLP